MSTWLDEKYLRLLGHRFRNFKYKGGHVYNWSCHECGDSRKNSRKSRAYGYVSQKGKFRWTCHNCGAGGSVSDLVKRMDGELFREYLMETFEESDRGRELASRRRGDDELAAIAATAKTGWEELAEIESPLDQLQAASSLPRDHQCPQLLERRAIPRHMWHELYHADSFFEWAAGVVPSKFSGFSGQDEPRLVIPFARGGRLIGFQGRSYGASRSKYITAAVDKDVPFLYGWDRLGAAGCAIAVEGPIDSMFLRNGLATGGGVIQAELEKTGLPREAFVVAYDNEPRNVETVKKMLRAVADGWRVCVWPDGLAEKDVNDMVLAGMTGDGVTKMVLDSARSGLEAELAIKLWKRVRL